MSVVIPPDPPAEPAPDPVQQTVVVVPPAPAPESAPESATVHEHDSYADRDHTHPEIMELIATAPTVTPEVPEIVNEPESEPGTSEETESERRSAGIIW